MFRVDAVSMFPTVVLLVCGVSSRRRGSLLQSCYKSGQFCTKLSTYFFPDTGD
jgi:hypothetical protein